MLSLQPSETGRQGVVLWGLGGFGKTRIALEYVERYQNDYSAIFWINASTYETAEDSFTQAATVLRDRLVLPPHSPSRGTRVNMRLVQQWLASSRNKDWLLVLDSLDDLDSFDCRDLIVKAMDGVPLAIEQARAMIKQGIPVRDFLGHFETQYQRIMAHKPARSAWDYGKNKSIMSVFSMLLTRLDKDGDAENIMSFASCFGPRPVALNLMGQVHQPKGSTGSSLSGQCEVQHTREMTWLDRFEDNRLEFQLATAQLESLCLVKLKRDSKGSIVSISLHDFIRRWRFETLTTEMKERWIIAAAYALSKCLPTDDVDQGSQVKFLPFIRHFYNFIRRYIEPQKLEAPEGELCHQYGHLMARFAPLYLNSQYTAEGEYVFMQAIDYRRIFEGPTWPTDRRSLLLLKGLATMFSKNGKMEDAAETTEALHDASTKLLGARDEITAWAAARLSVVTDRKIQYAENEQRAALASRDEKSSSTTPGRTSGEFLQSLPQNRPIFDDPDTDPTYLSGYTTLTLAALIGDETRVRWELDRGADINGHGTNSWNALQVASRNGHYAVVQLLLDRRADVNAIGRDGHTTLQFAAIDGSLPIVQLLLDNGADVNAANGSSVTPLQWAARNNHHSMVQLLLENGANVNGASGSTPLYWAAYNGHRSIVQLLLDNGANINGGNGSFGTPLQLASRNGHRSIVQLLLDNGASVTDARGEDTPLQLAACNGHHSIVQLLLDNGADVNAKGIKNRTALQLALPLGHTRVADLLIAAGARDDSRSCVLPSEED
ncbi:MAG: hypothetical protein Q9161_007631 [Pseudevernia consocians]